MTLSSRRRVLHALALVACAALLGAEGPAARKPAADVIPLLTAAEAAELEARVRKLHTRLAPAVVRLWGHGKDGKAFDDKGAPQGGVLSGVVIGKDGLILTCAHHGQKPGTAITVELADGRRLKGSYLGRFEPGGPRQGGKGIHQPDLGLARIEVKGDYAAAEVGPADLPAPGTLCLALGYPGTLPPGKPPLLRLGRTLNGPPEGHTIRVTSGYMPGDSGGPLFDLEGRVLGVVHGGDPHAMEYQSVAPLAKHRQALEGGKMASAPKEVAVPRPDRPTYQGPFIPADDLRTASLEAALGRVVVRDGVVEVAQGLAVDPDGWVVTKRTLVDGRADLNCRLFWTASGEVIVAAKVAALSAEHDLALLRLDPAAVRKINPKGLIMPKWAEAQPRVGQFVAWAGDSLRFAVVAAATGKEDVPYPDVAQLPLNVEEGPKGEPVVFPEKISISAEMDPFRRLFRKGDVVTHLNGTPTPTFKVFVDVHMKQTYAVGADGKYDSDRPAKGSFAGEPVVVTVLRGGKPVPVRAAKVHSAISGPLTWFKAPKSLRRDGFPGVFAHDGWVKPEECGGPVLDREGRVVGLNIARADDARTLAIPADVLRKVVAEMRKSAKE
jgi:serine protease Do